MSIFQRLGRDTTEPLLSPELKARLDALETANRRQNEQQDRFERIVKDLRLEWDEMYDKLRLLYARASKRLKDAANAEPDTSESRQDAPGTTNGDRLVGYGHPPLHDRANPNRRNY